MSFLSSYIVRKPVDTQFLVVSVLLILGGFLAFLSASFGLLARSSPMFYSVLKSQVLFGILPGLLLCYFISRFKHNVWKKVAVFIFVSALLFNCLLFIPGLSFEHGGATRWLNIFGVSVQPAEFLKIATIIYLAAWIASAKEKINNKVYGFIPFIIILSVALIFMMWQKDTDNAVVLTISAIGMFFVSGAKLKDILIMFLIGCLGFSILVFQRPYIKDRIMTFFDPSKNTSDSSYQVNQSLIAIGSGGILGKGFGQSVSKYGRLPEPIGDSIFAVVGEEFGLIGSLLVIFLYMTFLFQGFRIAIRAPDSLGRLLVVGIVILIVTQSFVNIASMLGLIPLSGLALVFISHGGSSILASLIALGFALGVSRSA
jgi:cell division protein FtsW